MYIVLNKYNYIVGYALIGEIEDSIYVDDVCDINIDRIRDYQYFGGEFVYNPIPEKPFGLNLEYDGSKWVEEASESEVEKALFQESVNFYKNELRLVSMANVELICGIINKDEFEEIKKYIKSIEPNEKVQKFNQIDRPEVLKKYI